jgi:hypothetical protein
MAIHPLRRTGEKFICGYYGCAISGIEARRFQLSMGK